MILYHDRRAAEAAGRIGVDRRPHMLESARDITIRVRTGRR